MIFIKLKSLYLNCILDHNDDICDDKLYSKCLLIFNNNFSMELIFDSITKKFNNLENIDKFIKNNKLFLKYYI